MIRLLKFGSAQVRKTIVTLLKKLRYGERICMDGIQGIRLNTKIIIDDGHISFGKNVAVNDRVSLTAVSGGRLSIGNGVSMNRNCIVICRECITIGDHCRFGPNVVIYDHDHVFNEEGIQPGFRKGNIIIEKGCWIGAGATILRNTHIGEGCVIGAGTIVKGDVPSHCLVTSDRNMRIIPIEKR